MRKSYTKVPKKIQDKHDVSNGNSKEGFFFPSKNNCNRNKFDRTVRIATYNNDLIDIAFRVEVEIRK